MSNDWEGSRRSGIALAMHHRLEWFIHLRTQGLSKEDEHPTNTLHEVRYFLLVPFTYCANAEGMVGNISYIQCGKV